MLFIKLVVLFDRHIRTSGLRCCVARCPLTTKNAHACMHVVDPPRKKFVTEPLSDVSVDIDRASRAPLDIFVPPRVVALSAASEQDSSSSDRSHDCWRLARTTARLLRRRRLALAHTTVRRARRRLIGWRRWCWRHRGWRRWWWRHNLEPQVWRWPEENGPLRDYYDPFVGSPASPVPCRPIRCDIVDEFARLDTAVAKFWNTDGATARVVCVWPCRGSRMRVRRSCTVNHVARPWVEGHECDLILGPRIHPKALASHCERKDCVQRRLSRAPHDHTNHSCLSRNDCRARI